MALKALIAGGISPDPLYPEIEEAHIKILEEQEEKDIVAEGTAQKYRDQEAARFLLRTLSVHEAKQLQNLETPEQDRLTFKMQQINFGDAVHYACHKGLVGWAHILDGDGEEAKFKGRRDKDECLVGATWEDVEKISLTERNEIYAAVRKLIAVSELVFPLSP